MNNRTTENNTSHFVLQGKPSNFWTHTCNNNNFNKNEYPSYYSSSNYNYNCSSLTDSTRESNLIGNITGQCPIGPLASGPFTSKSNSF